MGEFFRGAGDALRSLGWWRQAPRTMSLGLIPPLIVGAFGAAAFAAVMFFVLPPVVDAITSFADGWPAVWSGLLDAAVYGAVAVGMILLLNATFVALTLMVGDPFYERIWRDVETRLNGSAPGEEYSAWAAAGDALRLVVRGVWVAVVVWLIGLIPVVGAVLGFVVGLLLLGTGLVTELLDRPLTNRGFDRRARKALMRTQRARVLGFAATAQLGMMVPLVSIFTMPTIVAGSTELANRLLADAAPPQRAPAPHAAPRGLND